MTCFSFRPTTERAASNQFPDSPTTTSTCLRGNSHSTHDKVKAQPAPARKRKPRLAPSAEIAVLSDIHSNLQALDAVLAQWRIHPTEENKGTLEETYLAMVAGAYSVESATLSGSAATAG